MEQIQYKINFSKRAISSIGLDELTRNVMPNILSKTFPSLANLDFNIGATSNLDERFYDEYKKLQKITAEIELAYKSILDNFYKTHQISYPKPYLELVQRAKVLRKTLEKEYPIITEAYRMSNEETANSLDFDTNSRVGTGINHLVKMQKIAQYLDASSSIIADKTIRTASYLANSEALSITDHKANALINARFLENSLNQHLPKEFKAKSYGKITVNPIYEKLSLFKLPQSNHRLTLVASFPNGVDEELDALLNVARITESDTLSVTMDGANVSETEKLATHEGKRGYLRDVIVADRSIININNCEFKK